MSGLKLCPTCGSDHVIQVVDRDLDCVVGFKCEWCGAAHGERHPVTKSIVVLTTAHIYDDRPEAKSLMNLAALCQKCHNAHDAPSRRRGIRERKRAANLELALA